MSRQRTRHFAVALVLSAVLAAASAEPAVAGFTSPSNSSGPRSNAPAGVAQTRVAALASHTDREVFGYALASSLSDPTVGYPSWNFGLLSTVAFFGVHVGTAGQFAADNGWTVWNSSALTNLVSIAHQHGVKVLLTVILQDFSSNTPNMCAGLSHADATVAQAAAEVRAKGVDGVNIDYEGLDGSCGTNDPYWAQHAMNAFAQKMRAALGSSSYLSIATYAGAAADPYGFFDVAGLAAYVDSMFVMAYDMEYSNYSGSPLVCSRFCLGPTSPLTTYRYNDTGVMSQYVALVPASKVILGVPYYGRKACVSSASGPNQYPTSSVVADSYLDASGEAADPEVKPGSYTVHRESNSAGMERWDTWFNATLNCTRELYWDDAVALGKKYDLVNADALRGVGLWNLNYGGGAPELWAALQSHFASCTGVTVATAPNSPANIGTQVTITATATGCPNPRYEFWIRPASSSMWQLVQAYSTSPTYRWNSSGAPLGIVYLGVWARDAASTAPADVYGSTPYTLALACTSATLSFSPPPPLASGSGTAVTITASASGCPNPRYEFWIRPATSTTWQLVQAYSTSPTYRWNSSGALAGIVYLGVWARDASSTASADVYSSTPYTLFSPCTAARLSFSPPSSLPVGSGTPVTITAGASGCASPSFEFWMRPATSTTWQLVQAYSTSPTYRWNSSGAPAGIVYFGVWARDASSTASADVYSSTPYTLFSSCTTATLSFSPSSPLVHGSGTQVTITASSSGCTNPIYEFWMRPATSTTWQLVQAYSTSPTYRWNSNGAPAGTVYFGVWVRDAVSTASADVYSSTPYVLT
jgi:spore germination protein YaaH